jgi:hypothetical protein
MFDAKALQTVADEAASFEDRYGELSVHGTEPPSQLLSWWRRRPFVSRGVLLAAAGGATVIACGLGVTTYVEARANQDLRKANDALRLENEELKASLPSSTSRSIGSTKARFTPSS